MTTIARSLAANLLLASILSAVAIGLWMLYVPLEYVAIVTVVAGVFIKADDYRLRRARRRAALVPVEA